MPQRRLKIPCAATKIRGSQINWYFNILYKKVAVLTPQGRKRGEDSKFPISGNKGALLPPDAGNEGESFMWEIYFLLLGRQMGESEFPSCFGHFLSNINSKYSVFHGGTFWGSLLWTLTDYCLKFSNNILMGFLFVCLWLTRLKSTWTF